MSIKGIITLILCGLLCFSALAGCAGDGVGSTPGSSGTTTDNTETGSKASPDTPAPPPDEPETNNSSKQTEGSDVDKIQATLTMEDGGTIVMELYPKIAPQSVRNFVYLARQGFYDGLTFHRIIEGFMIQGGDPDGNGTGGPGYSIFGEFEQNGWENNLKHRRGVLSMARSGMPNSAGSQFFIMHKDADFLDGGYAAFGKVTSGMDVVDKLVKTPVTDNNGTVAEENKPIIKSITIDSDVELPEPEKLKK